MNVLLHVCCAPDATVPWPALLEEFEGVVAFFYGNHIHPEAEYVARAEAAEALRANLSGTLELSPYEPHTWLEAVSGYEDCPEGGDRCALCFRLQLEAAAECARTRGCGAMTTTLTISPHKDPARINAIGKSIADAAGLSWLEHVWRKGGGFARSVDRSRLLKLYRQTYCGCVFSQKEGAV